MTAQDQQDMKQILSVNPETFQKNTENKAFGYPGLSTAVVAQEMVRQYGADALGSTDEQLGLLMTLMGTAAQRAVAAAGQKPGPVPDQNALTVVDAMQLALDIVRKNEMARGALLKKPAFSAIANKLLDTVKNPLLIARGADILHSLDEEAVVSMTPERCAELDAKVAAVADNTAAPVLGVPGSAQARAIEAKPNPADGNVQRLKSISAANAAHVKDTLNNNKFGTSACSAEDVKAIDEKNVAVAILALAGAGRTLLGLQTAGRIALEKLDNHRNAHSAAQIVSYLNRTLLNVCDAALKLGSATQKAVYDVAALRCVEGLLENVPDTIRADAVLTDGLKDAGPKLDALMQRDFAIAKTGWPGMHAQTVRGVGLREDLNALHL